METNKKSSITLSNIDDQQLSEDVCSDIDQLLTDTGKKVDRKEAAFIIKKIVKKEKVQKVRCRYCLGDKMLFNNLSKHVKKYHNFAYKKRCSAKEYCARAEQGQPDDNNFKLTVQ